MATDRSAADSVPPTNIFSLFLQVTEQESSLYLAQTLMSYSICILNYLGCVIYDPLKSKSVSEYITFRILESVRFLDSSIIAQVISLLK